VTYYSKSSLPEVGELRSRLTFQVANEIDDGYGGKQVEWADRFNAWAYIEPLSGREYFDAMQIQTEISHRVIVRYRNDITPDMRIKYGGRILEIEAVIDIGNQHRFLEILCRE
jgi:SPP1 family predicted phage head-tail adaptor